MDRVQQVADEIFGLDHDFTLEEILSEMVYFRGESYHTVHECTGDDVNEKCLFGNYSHYANMVRSKCEESLSECFWNEKKFECCQHFLPLESEIGKCFALNSAQTNRLKNQTKLSMISNRFTGPGKLRFKVSTESYLYTIGSDEVPNLVSPKTDILQIDQFISYK